MACAHVQPATVKAHAPVLCQGFQHPASAVAPRGHRATREPAADDAAALIADIRRRLAARRLRERGRRSPRHRHPVLNAPRPGTALTRDQMVPEFSAARGRVDFALLRLGQQAGASIEVKRYRPRHRRRAAAVRIRLPPGRAAVCPAPMAANWSFYLPGGQGSYDDRRVYRLQLDDRSPEELRADPGSATSDTTARWHRSGLRRSRGATIRHAGPSARHWPSCRVPGRELVDGHEGLELLVDSACRQGRSAVRVQLRH